MKVNAITVLKQAQQSESDEMKHDDILETC